MEFFSKTLKDTDINVRLEVPIIALRRFNFAAGHYSVNLQVMDWTEQWWTFRFFRRQDDRHPRPAMSGAWLEFVQNRGLRIGDRVIFKLDGGRYRVEAMRKISSTGLKLLGKDVDWVPVDRAIQFGIARV